LEDYINTVTALRPGQYYHIYNRGNNRENLFYEERNYLYFLQLYARYTLPVADTYAYCLMRNHFHLLVRIKTEEEYYTQPNPQPGESRVTKFVPSQNFSNLFNAYSKAINKAYNRTGSLFQDRFSRREVNTDAYFINLIFYIHYNPQKHGFVDDFRDWLWSSYGALCSAGPTKLQRKMVMEWFGGVSQYHEFHQGMVDERKILDLIEEDF
jgi:REP element-mobilizing transposase RayT